MAITITTNKAVKTYIGGLLDPGDGITDVDYQKADVNGDWSNHQIWVNYIRNDKTKLLKNIYKNVVVFHIISIFSSFITGDIDTAVASMATLTDDRNEVVKAALVSDPQFNNLVRKSEITSELTDGGYYANDSVNPKSVTIITLSLEYYTRK